MTNTYTLQYFLDFKSHFWEKGATPLDNSAKPGVMLRLDRMHFLCQIHVHCLFFDTRQIEIQCLFCQASNSMLNA